MPGSGNQIEIPFDKKKMKWKLFRAIVLMAAGILYISIPLSHTRFSSYQQYTANGWIFIIFSSILGFHSLKRLVNSKPGFLIDSRGIEDHSGTINAGPILWADITKVRIMKILWQRTIVIVVNNPQAYINKQKNWFNKLPMSLNDVFFHSPFCINARELNISLNNLFEQVDSNLKNNNERSQLANEQ